MKQSTKLAITSSNGDEGESSKTLRGDEIEKYASEITNVRIFDLSSSVNSNKNNNNRVVIIVHRV